MNEDVQELTRRFEGHLKDYRLHTDEEVARKAQDDARYEQTMATIDSLAEATKGAVEAYNFASAFPRFVKWLSSFAIFAAIAAYFSKHFQ